MTIIMILLMLISISFVSAQTVGTITLHSIASYWSIYYGGSRILNGDRYDAGNTYNLNSGTGTYTLSSAITSWSISLLPGYESDIYSGTNSDNYITITEVATPVELSSFVATKKNAHISLTWCTESETENQGYILERRTANEDSWTEIGSYISNDDLLGHGTTTETHDYSFIDNTVQSENTYQYRLGDVDFSNNIIWHEEITITIKAEELNMLNEFGLQKAYPNPFNPEITLQYYLSESGVSTLIIYNLQGQLVKTLQSGLLSAGSHSAVWQPKNIGSGMYIVHLQSGNSINMQKIMYVK